MCVGGGVSYLRTRRRKKAKCGPASSPLEICFRASPVAMLCKPPSPQYSCRDTTCIIWKAQRYNWAHITTLRNILRKDVANFGLGHIVPSLPGGRKCHLTQFFLNNFSIISCTAKKYMAKLIYPEFYLIISGSQMTLSW